MDFGLVLVAGALFVYSVVSRRLSTTIFTGPIIFVSLGLLLGPEAAGWVELELNTGIIELLLEATLVLVLFSDAMSINTSRWRQEASVPGRLLGVGLPLTIAVGWFLAATIFGDLEFFEAALVGVILAPTDAALGQAVVSNPRVPERIRQGLNVESGLNDGIALPVFFVILEAARVEEGDLAFTTLLSEIGKEVALALAIGIAVGWLGSKAITYASRRDWLERASRRGSLAALAFAAYALADTVGGSGFIAAWVAGLVVGRYVCRAFPNVQDFVEEASHILTLLSFFVFGALVLAPALTDVTWEVALYAVLSLTLIRMVPVALSMLGEGMRPPSVAYLAWFGPRGLASIILVLIAAEDANLAGIGLIKLIMAITVGLSVFAHGVTAWWGSNAYADWYESHRKVHPDMMESEPMPEIRVSGRFGPRMD